MPRTVYLDHNATTPVFPEVVDAMRACWAEPHLNPASQHSFGRRARAVLEDARDRIGEILGANLTGPNPDRVIFTSGGTESNNLAVRGILQTVNAIPSDGAGRFSGPVTPPPHLIISAIEHPSISTLAVHLAQQGYTVDRLDVDSNGVIRVADLARLIRPETRLVAAMVANNETGVIQPIHELAAICAERGVAFHTDAAQAAGKLPLSFRDLAISTMSIAAHKFGGPLGIGALLVRYGVNLAPQQLGGFQQAGMRAGSEPVALAVGMRCALELWQANRPAWAMHLALLRDEFEAILRFRDFENHGAPALKTCEPVIVGRDADRLPNTSNIAFVGLDRQQLFLALDQAGIACSTGSACASGSSDASPVLIAMECDSAVVSSALRFSFGVSTTLDDVEEAAHRIVRICNDLGQRKRP
jgi:cysteine desulfurase